MNRRTITALCAAALLVGCANARLAPPQPVFSGLRTLRSADLPPLAVGRFAAGPELPRGHDAGIRIRGAPLRPPEGSTFSAYLGETLRINLVSDNRLDPSAALRVSGLLVANEVSAGVGADDGRGSIAATFIVERNGREIWRRTLRAERTWRSSLIGAVAYIQADAGYGGLYQELVEQLIADPDFQRAVRAER